MRILMTSAGLALFLAACGETSTPPETEAAAPPPVAEPAELEPVDVAVEPEEAIAGMGEGEFCYFREDEQSTEGLEITVNIAGVYSGRHYGTIHDDANSYFAAFETLLTDGILNEEGVVNFDAVTEVDGDTQFSEEPWVITEESAYSPHWEDAVMAAADCDYVDATVWPPIPE